MIARYRCTGHMARSATALGASVFLVLQVAGRIPTWLPERGTLYYPNLSQNISRSQSHTTGLSAPVYASMLVAAQYHLHWPSDTMTTTRQTESTANQHHRRRHQPYVRNPIACSSYGERQQWRSQMHGVRRHSIIICPMANLLHGLDIVESTKASGDHERHSQAPSKGRPYEP